MLINAGIRFYGFKIPGKPSKTSVTNRFKFLGKPEKISVKERQIEIYNYFK